MSACSVTMRLLPRRRWHWKPAGIVLSQVPAHPTSGICLDVIARLTASCHLGVCLGHQAYWSSLWRRYRSRSRAKHGKLSTIITLASRCFAPKQRFSGDALPLANHRSPLHARGAGVTALEMASSKGDAQNHPVHGVQFHPESIAS